MKNYNPKKSHAKRKAIAALRTPGGYTRYFYNQNELTAYLTRQGAEFLDSYSKPEVAIEKAAENVEPITPSGEKTLKKAEEEAAEQITEYTDTSSKFEIEHSDYLLHHDDHKYVRKVSTGRGTRYFYSDAEYQRWLNKQYKKSRLKDEFKEVTQSSRKRKERALNGGPYFKGLKGTTLGTIQRAKRHIDGTDARTYSTAAKRTARILKNVGSTSTRNMTSNRLNYIKRKVGSIITG